MLKKFAVNPNAPQEAESEILSFIKEQLHDCRLNIDQETQANLMAEESLMTLMKHADFTSRRAIFVRAVRFLGSVSIRLTVPGEKFNFADIMKFDVPLDDEGMPETLEAIQRILLQSFRDKLSYSHSSGYNTISVKASRSPHASLYMTFTALISAVILGLLMKNSAPESLCTLLNASLFVPVRTMYMNALKALVAPVVFFSMLTCMTQFSSFAELGRIGGRLLASFLSMTVTATLLGAGAFYVLQPGEWAVLASSGEAASSPQAISAAESIVNIVPSNFVRPFLEMNMLQIIFLAFILGVGLGMIGGAADPLKVFFDSCLKLFMAVIKIIINLIPLAAFLLYDVCHAHRRL
ncbi:MAG: cation:dicarboxylase symporter family transporter [Synergistaceae bacterium]|nr:cation:dicarboxylase symporter family transporter [Synergistaceae bacterium]